MRIDREKLLTAQARAGLSRIELLRKANISAAAFNGIGTRKTTPKIIHKIAAALNCDVLDLIADQKEE